MTVLIFKMSKRKINCTVNDFVIEYLKKAKHGKTLKLIAENDSESDEATVKTLQNFINYLKQIERKTKIENDDDFGFEINFGEYQQAAVARKTISGKIKTGSKNEVVKKNDVPKEFIKKIQKLGMKIEDGELLYKTKINWTAVYSENKLYCTEHGCDYFTKIDGDELKNHMITIHNYGEYPCPYQDCDYVGVSKVSDIQINKALGRRYFRKTSIYMAEFIHESMKKSFGTNVRAETVKQVFNSNQTSNRISVFMNMIFISVNIALSDMPTPFILENI